MKLPAVVSALLTCFLLLLGTSAQAQTVLRQGSNSPPETVYHRQWLDLKNKLEKTSNSKVR